MAGACERNGVVVSLTSRKRNSMHWLKRKLTVRGLKTYCEKSELTKQASVQSITIDTQPECVISYTQIQKGGL